MLTPENVELRFELAGLGSRVAAALIDYGILFVTYSVITIGGSFAITALAFPTSESLVTSQLLGYVTIALVTLLTFFGWWGYFILFELLWNGQSIGKRALGLRVVRDEGQPIGLTSSLVRNLLRLVDLFLGIGVVIILLDRRGRRLGDFAAGTLVVREPRYTSLVARSRAFDPVEIPPVAGRPIEELLNADKLTLAHYTVIRDFFARRSKLPPRRSAELSAQLAKRIATTLGVDSSNIGDPVAFLATAARAFESRQNRAL